jgi:D-inositol-3-phosphate glycosyltransferase
MSTASRLRIAVLEPTAHGGLLHYSAQLADALATRGHAVDLLAPRGNELVRRSGAARMRAVLPAPAGPGAPATRAGYLRRRTGVALRLSAAWLRMLWETRPGRYDVILHGADVGLPPALLGTAAMSVAPGRARLVRIAHNVRAFNRWSGEDVYAEPFLQGRPLRWLYRRFDLVLVHGERSRAEFEATWGKARLAVIPHGDERLFGDAPPPATDERVLFFGDWRKVKGIDVLLEAFDLLAGRRPSVRLTVAGSPSPGDWDPRRLHAWARGHQGRVELIDRYVPIEDVRATFARARVVATPYLAGYQSGVIHLAGTMARPVVTSDVGDLPAAVEHGVTGLVVPAGNAPALAEALETVLADPELAARMGAAAAARVRAGSSWAVVAHRVEDELAALGA